MSFESGTEGTPIVVYDTSGKQYGSTTAEKDRATITTSLCPGFIAIVKIGEKAVKIAIKELRIEKIKSKSPLRYSTVGICLYMLRQIFRSILYCFITVR